MSVAGRFAGSVSIVVPVLNEAATIRGALVRLRTDFPRCEPVVVDGGSTDATVAAAGGLARVLPSGRGRALQMNTGAAHTKGDVLWFVRADTLIAPQALPQLGEAVHRARHGADGGVHAVPAVAVLRRGAPRGPRRPLRPRTEPRPPHQPPPPITERGALPWRTR